MDTNPEFSPQEQPREGDVSESPEDDDDAAVTTTIRERGVKNSGTFSFLATGRDFQPADISHQYTEQEKRFLGTFTSLDYLPSHSNVYKNWLKRQRSSRYQVHRWLLMGIIGFTVGFIGFVMHQLIELIADVKWTKATEYIESSDYVAAWGWSLAYSVLFVLVSSSTVVFLCPSAGGSGIPEVTGFLNGTHIPKMFSLKTMIVKFISCVCAVGCNMPVGPEGPMIHLGALVGATLSQYNIRICSQFHNPEDKRNFISAGAAAGVASAFGAPVGGLLFSMEEVSSFWTTTLSWQIFFCCMVSTFTTDLFNSALTRFTYTGDFGYFKKERYILFSIAYGINVNILMFLPTLVIGVIGGMLGALFTFISLKLTRTRKRVLGHMKKFTAKIVKVLEPAFLMLVMTTVCLFAPALFSCSQFTCAEGQPSNIRYSCKNDSRTDTHVEASVARYHCPRGSSWSVSNTTYYTNETYNEVATLLFWTGEDAVKHLFSRETPFEFGYVSLCSVLPFYFLMVCWASGTAVSAGILVPMLFIGGLYGRTIGRVLISILVSSKSTDEGYWNWMDPGAFALIGAASFFGGVTRLTKAVTVIMIELTNDVQFLLPIMVAIMVAKWIGDFFTHPHYHSLLELKCIPFLPPEPQVVIDKKLINLDLFKVSDVMSQPVIIVKERESVDVLARLLRETQHGGFPIVRTKGNVDSSFCGIITRQELNVLMLQEELFESTDAQNELYDVTLIEYTELRPDRAGQPPGLEEKLKAYVSNRQYTQLFVDLKPYINQSAMCIPERFSLYRTYIIFRSLGLRHLVVTDDKNSVVGMITRKDLMDFNLVAKISKVLNREIQTLEIGVPLEVI
ncbi:channel C-like [Octopus vulgaris]|uniref:Chloride channel protein n=1 Tax=Octopus vulgaris TaxID=6645 RepID=A0AA36BYW3_OCTVU|nr:channel C-like [Octopus vulgaris]